MSIVWDPPPAVRAGTKGSRVPLGLVREIALELSERPGEWAHILTFPSAERQATTFVRDVKSGQISALKGAEAVSRKVDGEHRVYARFPAPAKSEAAVVASDLDGVAIAVLERLLSILREER